MKTQKKTQRQKVNKILRGLKVFGIYMNICVWKLVILVLFCRKPSEHIGIYN